MRPHHRVLRAGAAVAALLLPCVAVADGDVLIVQVRSDLAPGTDFDTVRVEVTRTDVSPPLLVAVVDTPAAARDFTVGVRVTELTVPEHSDYRLSVKALKGGTVVVDRPVRGPVYGGHFHWAWGAHAHFDRPQVEVVTVLLTVARQPVTASQSVTVVEDADGSGGPTPGDTVRFRVDLEGDDLEEGSQYHHDLPPGLLLLPESIVATHGQVIVENQPLEDAFRLDLAPLAPGEAASIWFDAVLDPVVVSQGVLSVRTGEQSAYAVFTDDPQTEAWQDPLVFGLACGRQAPDGCADDLETCGQELEGCEADLGRARRALGACQDDVADLRAQLAAFRRDLDGDGVPDALDACPRTARGAPVDARGCAQAQFCGAVRPGSGFTWFLDCWAADWRDDEPGVFAQDCVPVWGQRSCRAR
ncbi:MAG: hypothetical protein H6732_03400 [Alphaproteobacteria bacterium]|nr:hypothetical protein [Alphaproteobacteria bacterium]